MTPEEFTQLAGQQYNRIPVSREIAADLDTPLSSYLKLAQGSYSYLFESVQGGEKWGRYSIIGLPCRTVLKVFGHTVNIEIDGVVNDSFDVDDPLVYVEEFKAKYAVPSLPALPIFAGGLVGYFGYDTVRYVEKKLADSCPPDVIGTPDILLMVSEDVLIFDNLASTLSLITHADPQEDDALLKA